MLSSPATPNNCESASRIFFRGRRCAERRAGADRRQRCLGRRTRARGHAPARCCRRHHPRRSGAWRHQPRQTRWVKQKPSGGSPSRSAGLTPLLTWTPSHAHTPSLWGARWASPAMATSKKSRPTSMPAANVQVINFRSCVRARGNRPPPKRLFGTTFLKGGRTLAGLRSLKIRTPTASRPPRSPSQEIVTIDIQESNPSPDSRFSASPRPGMTQRVQSHAGYQIVTRSAGAR
jgi:hypothetical protein